MPTGRPAVIPTLKLDYPAMMDSTSALDLVELHLLVVVADSNWDGHEVSESRSAENAASAGADRDLKLRPPHK